MKARGRVNRMAGAVLAVVALVAVASGCASAPNAGAAATLGSRDIPNDTLTTQVDEVLEARGTGAGAPDAALVADVLQRLVITALVDEGAVRNGVVVTQGQIDQAISEAEAQLGGADQLLKVFLDSNVPASAISDQFRLSLQVDGLGALLAPDADDQGRQQAVFTYAVDLSKQLDTRVSPRYGTWVPDELQVGPLPTDLSSPQAPQGDPLADVIPSG